MVRPPRGGRFAQGHALAPDLEIYYALNTFSNVDKKSSSVSIPVGPGYISRPHCSASGCHDRTLTARPRPHIHVVCFTDRNRCVAAARARRLWVASRPLSTVRTVPEAAPNSASGQTFRDSHGLRRVAQEMPLQSRSAD